MAAENEWAEVTEQVTVPSEVVARLAEDIGCRAVRREPVRVWAMSGVERVHFEGEGTAILKYATPPLSSEPLILAHAARHGVPVPEVYIWDFADRAGIVAMLMEDLGEPARPAALQDAAKAALALHACPTMPGLRTLDRAGLAAMPRRALRWLDDLNEAGRWQQETAAETRSLLGKLDQIAEDRSQGADLPPFGLCHSEFHPTSLHVSADGAVRPLDLARAFNGPGLIDLVSWQGTPPPFKPGAVAELIERYIQAGGDQAARAERGGVPAHLWAAGWFKIWVAEWFIEGCLRWPFNPTNDHLLQPVVNRHLREAVECLA